MPIGLLRSHSSSGGGRHPNTNGDAHSGNLGCSNERSNDAALSQWSGSGRSANQLEATPTNTQEVAATPSAIVLREILDTPFSRARTPHCSTGSNYCLSGAHSSTALPSSHSGQLSAYQPSHNRGSTGDSRSDGGSCLANSTVLTESLTADQHLQHALPEPPRLTGSMSPVLLPTTPKADDTPLCELSSVALHSTASGHRRWTTAATTSGGDGAHADLAPLGSSRSSVLYASQELSMWPEGGRVSSVVALLDGLSVTSSACPDPPLPPSSSRAPSRIPRPPPLGIRSSACLRSSASSPLWAMHQSMSGTSPVTAHGAHTATPSPSAAVTSHAAATPETLSLISSSSVSPSIGPASSQPAASRATATTGALSGPRSGSAASTPSALPVSTSSRPRTRRFDSAQGGVCQQLAARRSSFSEAAAGGPLPALACSPLSLAAASLARPPFNLYGKANTKNTASAASRASSAASTEGRCGASAAPVGSVAAPSSGSGSRLRRGEVPPAQGSTAHASTSRGSGGPPSQTALSSRAATQGASTAQTRVKPGTAQRPASSGSAQLGGGSLVRPRGGPSQSAGSAQAAAGNRLPRPVVSTTTGAALSLLQKRSTTAAMIGPRGPSALAGMPCVNNVRCMMRRPVYRYSVDSACSDSIQVLHAPLPSTPGRPEAAGTSPQHAEYHRQQHPHHCPQLLASTPPHQGSPLSPASTLPLLRSPCCPSPVYQSPGLGLPRQPPCSAEDMMPMASPDPAVIATDIARCRAGLVAQELLSRQGTWQWTQRSCEDGQGRETVESAVSLGGKPGAHPARGSSDSDDHDAGFGLPAWAWRSVAVLLDTGGADMTPRMRQRQEQNGSGQQQQQQEEEQQQTQRQQQQQQQLPVAAVPRPLLLGNTDEDPSLMPLRRLSTTPKRCRRPCTPVPSVPLPAIVDTPLLHNERSDLTISISMPEPALTESPSPVSPTPPRPTYRQPSDTDLDCTATSHHHMASSELPIYRLPSESVLSSDNEEPAMPVAAADLDAEASAGETVLPMKEFSRFDLDALVADSLLVPGTEGACTDWIEAISPPRLHAAAPPPSQAVELGAHATAGEDLAWGAQLADCASDAAQAVTSGQELEEDFVAIARYGASCYVAASRQGSGVAVATGAEKDGLPGGLSLEGLRISSSGSGATSGHLSAECSAPDAERLLSSVTDEPVSPPCTPLPCSGADMAMSDSACQLGECAEDLETAAEAPSPRHTQGSCRAGRRPVNLSISLENLQAVDLQALLHASNADMLFTIAADGDSEEYANPAADMPLASTGIPTVELEHSAISEDVTSIAALQLVDADAAAGVEVAVGVDSENAMLADAPSSAVAEVAVDLEPGSDGEDTAPVCILRSVVAAPCTRCVDLDASMLEEASVLLGVDSCLSLGLPEPLTEVLSVTALGTPSDGALHTAPDFAGVMALTGFAAAAAMAGIVGVSVCSNDMVFTASLLAAAAACKSTWGAVAGAAAAMAPTQVAALVSVSVVAAAAGDKVISRKRCNSVQRPAGESCVSRPCGVMVGALDINMCVTPKGLVPRTSKACGSSKCLNSEDIAGARVGSAGDSDVVLCDPGAHMGASEVSIAAAQQDAGAESAVVAAGLVAELAVPSQACGQSPPDPVELAPAHHQPTQPDLELLSGTAAASHPDDTHDAAAESTGCSSPHRPATPPSLLNVAAVAVEACSATIAAMRAAGCDRSALRQVARAFGVLAGRQYAAERDKAMLAGSMPIADWLAVQDLVRKYLGREEDAFSIAAAVAVASECQQQASALQQSPCSRSGSPPVDATDDLVPAEGPEAQCSACSSDSHAADCPQPSPDPCRESTGACGVEDASHVLTQSCSGQQLLTTLTRLAAGQASDDLLAAQAEASCLEALAVEREAFVASLADSIAVQFAVLDAAARSESAALAALQEHREGLLALVASGAACNAAVCTHASTAAAAAVQCLVQHRARLLQQLAEEEAAGSSAAAVTGVVEDAACHALMAARQMHLRAYAAETAAAVAAAVTASCNEAVAFCKLARVRNIVTGVCLAIEALDVADTLRGRLAEDEALRLLSCERDQEKALCAILAVTSSAIACRTATAEEAALEAMDSWRQQDLAACSRVAADSARAHCCAADQEANEARQLARARSQLAGECLALEAACAALMGHAVGAEEEAVHALAAGRQQLLKGVSQHTASTAVVTVRGSSAVAYALWVQWSRRYKQLARVAQAAGCQAADADRAAYGEAAACDAMAVLRRDIRMLISAHTAAEAAANVRATDCEQQAYERLARLCGVIMGVCHAVEAAEEALSLRAGAAQMESMRLLALQRSSNRRMLAAAAARHSAIAVRAAVAEATSMQAWAAHSQGWILSCTAAAAASAAVTVRAADMEDEAMRMLAAGRQRVLTVVAEQAAADAAAVLHAHSGESRAFDTLVLDRLLRLSSGVHERSFIWCAAAFSQLMQQRVSHYAMMCGTSMVLLTVHTRALAAAGCSAGPQPGTCAMEAAATVEGPALTAIRLGNVSMPLHRALVRSFPLRSLSGTSDDSEAGSGMCCSGASNVAERVVALSSFYSGEVEAESDLLAACTGKRLGPRSRDVPSHRYRGLGLGLLVRGPDGRLRVRAFSSYFSGRAASGRQT